MKENKVYLLECQGLYKIGKTTTRTVERVRALTTGNPFEITCIAEVYRSDCSGLELFLHNKFKDKKVKGEWFNLTEEDVEFVRNLSNTIYNDHKEVGIIKTQLDSTYEEECTAIAADGHTVRRGMRVLLVLPGTTRREVVIDFIKTPEYVDGVLEYVAISDPFVNVHQYLNSCEWTSPRYLYTLGATDE